MIDILLLAVGTIWLAILLIISVVVLLAVIAASGEAYQHRKRALERRKND